MVETALRHQRKGFEVLIVVTSTDMIENQAVASRAHELGEMAVTAGAVLVRLRVFGRAVRNCGKITDGLPDGCLIRKVKQSVAKVRRKVFQASCVDGWTESFPGRQE